MVDYKKIEDVCQNIFAGGTPNTKREDYYDGSIPWIRSGEVDFNVITRAERNISELGYKNSSAKLIRKGSVVMAMTGATVAKSAIVEFETSANQSVCALETNENIITYRFLYYVLAKNYFTIKSSAQGALTSLNLSMIKQIEIPVPSIPIQQEIVRILDSFTSMITNLETELASRQKQYEYYRNKLLTFDENDETVEWKTINEVFDTRNGYTPSTQNLSFWENGVFPWFKMEDIREKGHILSDSNLHITQSAIKGKGLFKANSIILATSATIGEHALITVEHLSNQRFTNFYPKKDYIDIIDMKYMHYYFYVIDRWCKEHTIQGNFAGVNMSELYSYIIPIPSKERQQEIVSTLDTFESLISNIKQELDARKKQYEYYREKLLTFE